MKTHRSNEPVAHTDRQARPAARADALHEDARPALADSRTAAAHMDGIRQLANGSSRALQLKRQAALTAAGPASDRKLHVQRMADDSPRTARSGEPAAETAARSPGRREERPNRTGLPDRLKSGIEALSGMSMDHVKVHYDSHKPAQLQAHAYAQGSDIHLGPGQEKHLPHEAWHVVQQAQGRVRPTLMTKTRVAVNDDAGLEREADVMGARALQERTAGAPSTVAQGVRPVMQRVRFSNSNSFYGAHHDASTFAPALAAAIGAGYRGKPESQEFMVTLSQEAKQLIKDARLMTGGPEAVGDFIWAEVRAADWEKLGIKQQMANIEIEATSQRFFDEQTVLMNALQQRFSEHIAARPGRPLRIATFRFSRSDEGPLVTNWAAKNIEPQVATSVDAVFLPPEAGPIREQIQANVNQTLFSAGQFHWIAANWANISATHDVYVDVDYYPNRMPDRGGLLHKDSVGETLFVNLTYNNDAPAASAEYVADNIPFGPFEDNLPKSAKDLIAATRAANAGDDGSIKGVDLPARGRTSFIDPAIWHATPLYGRRIPELPVKDHEIGTYEQIRGWINENVTGQQRDAALAVLAGRDGPVMGFFAKYLLRTDARTEPLRIGQRAGGSAVDTAPFGRRRRARSVDLTAHPERLQQLQQQATQARSFIRTWVILRKRS